MDINWTVVLSAASVATIFAGAWVKGRARKVRPECAGVHEELERRLDRLQDQRERVFAIEAEMKALLQRFEMLFRSVDDRLTRIEDLLLGTVEINRRGK